MASTSPTTTGNPMIDEARAVSGALGELARLKGEPMPLSDLEPEKYGPNGPIDIIKDYSWTVAPKTAEARKNIPILELVEYEMDVNALLANLKFWVTQIAGNVKNPYEGLYRAYRTGVVYRFPWLESYHHNINQNWEDFKGLESTKWGELFLKGIELITASPGIAINTPKVWKGATRASIGYTITLFNTVNPEVDIMMNKILINRLIASSLHDQQGPILATPPALYRMKIAGVRNSPAVVLSNVTVESLGVLKKTGTSAFIPEAYRITFQMNELIAESRQIFNSTVTGGRVMAAIAPP